MDPDKLKLMSHDRLFGRTGLTGLAAGALLIVLSACAVVSLDPPTPDDFPVHGLDVSTYQAGVNWTAVRNGGLSFAWIKATEGGDRLDDRFAENWTAAATAGLARGAYHFWYFCRPAAEQAAWFIQHVPVDPTALPPVLDMEWTPDSPTCTRRPAREDIHREMNVWLKAIEAHYGKRPVIYTSVDFHRDRLVGAFDDYHIWVRSVAGHPSLRYGGRRWHFWQHTATGAVPGVNGNVDRNVFYGSASDWAKFVNGKLAPKG